MPEDINKRNKRITEWQRNNRRRIVILADKDTAQRIDEARGTQSMNAYILEAVREKLIYAGISGGNNKKAGEE